jgi:acyl carrier protein phosphodiesterase
MRYPIRNKTTVFCHTNLSIMNFLAHLALSGNREGIVMGNYTGDFIKGKISPERTNSWSEEYRVGVELHRYIDSYTDTHPTVLRAKRVLARAHPKVAGVALDIYYDYFLALHFQKYYEEELPDFVRKSYGLILRNRELIPAAMLPMAEAMIRHDWLLHYKTIPGIRRSFEGLANRFTFMAGIRGAEYELIKNERVYEDSFLEFYPSLKVASEKFIHDAGLE